MSETSSIDPYRPPEDWENHEPKPPLKFRPILEQWQPLRTKYNLIMLAVGALTALPVLGLAPLSELIVGALFYGLLANIFFTLEVIPEVILTWMTKEGDHPNVRRIVFLIGLSFSIALTLLIGLSMIMPWPDKFPYLNFASHSAMFR